MLHFKNSKQIVLETAINGLVSFTVGVFIQNIAIPFYNGIRFAIYNSEFYQNMEKESKKCMDSFYDKESGQTIYRKEE